MSERMLTLDGESLTWDDVVAVARGRIVDGARVYPTVRLEDRSREHLETMRHALRKKIQAREPMYGVNTGAGSRKDKILAEDELLQYQRHYIPAHCVGVGEPFPEEIVRAVMILRANSFAKGNSGVRPELCDAILDAYNRGFIPLVPRKGSVGASGDLCPLAHVAAALTGEPKQLVSLTGDAAPLPAPAALERAGMKALRLEAKEGMAMTNGATFIQATGILAVHDAQRLLTYSHLAAALSLEAIRGEVRAYDERIHAARNHEGQTRVAAAVRRLVERSGRCSDACREEWLRAEAQKFNKSSQYPAGKRLPRVQDPYSFRCYPQVAGASLEGLEFARRVLDNEINASTDNPLIFPRDDGGYDVLSGGNFHGEPLAHACDYLKIAIQAIASISERRFYALLMPGASYGLPADLVPPLSDEDVSLNTGLMILQYMAAGLVSENKVLCHPASVDSIPTSANQEDYVSMGTHGALHARQVVENATVVVASELIAACRGITLTQDELGGYPLGRGTARAYEVLRRELERDGSWDDDRYYAADLQRVLAFLRGDELLEVVESAIDGE